MATEAPTLATQASCGNCGKVDDWDQAEAVLFVCSSCRGVLARRWLQQEQDAMRDDHDDCHDAVTPAIVFDYRDPSSPPSSPGRDHHNTHASVSEESFVAEECIEDCPICLEKLNESNRIALPCNHCFHVACMDRLRTSDVSQACPLCRAPLPMSTDDVNEEGTRCLECTSTTLDATDAPVSTCGSAHVKQALFFVHP